MSEMSLLEMMKTGVSNQVQTCVMHSDFSAHRLIDNAHKVRFEAFTAVTMKNVVFWDVALCRSCVN
jgi:hypothetical protein